MNTRNTNVTSSCQCQFCTCRYYSFEEHFKKALNESNTEDDFVHKIFMPISRIVIPKRLWTSALAPYYEDANATAIDEMYHFKKEHGGLEPTKDCFYMLFSIAKRGASKTLEDYYKHVLPYAPEIDEGQDENDRKADRKSGKKRIIGRRVYLANMEEQLAPKINEDDEISAIDTRDTKRKSEQILSSTKSEIIYQVIANLALYFGWSMFQGSEFIKRATLLKVLANKLVPLAEEAHLEVEKVHDFFSRAEKELPDQISIKKLKNKAYNRKKSKTLLQEL